MSVPNLRDLGGLTAAGGRTLLHDRLLRSAIPIITDVPHIDVTWPPRTVVDLTSPGELHVEHPLASTGANIVNVPLLDCLGERAGRHTSLTDLYRDLLDRGSRRFVEIVELISESPGTTLVHCAAGKDRTGLVVALLLRLLGVAQDDVVQDYLRSADWEDEVTERIGALGLAGPLAAPPAAFRRVSPIALTAVLTDWDTETAGVTEWYLQRGGKITALERLRARLLAEPSEHPSRTG